MHITKGVNNDKAKYHRKTSNNNNYYRILDSRDNRNGYHQ